MDRSHNSLSILHITLSIGETSAPYNEHCLPVAHERKIAICTFFKAQITPPPEITLFAGDNTFLGFFRALKRALAQQSYDVIHVHAPHVGVLFLLATLFKPRSAMPATVYTLHSTYPVYELRHKLMFVPIFAMFQKVVGCSEASAASFPAFFKWLAGDRLCAVPNGLDITRVDRIVAKGQRQALPKQGFTTIAIGRLVEIKNPFTIVAAFGQSAEQGSHLLYVGDGPLRAALNDQSRTAGLEQQIEFTGLIPREQVFARLLNADLFISTSHAEGLPVAVLEAMACRCPVLLSDIPSHREIAKGVNFIPLVKPNDVAGFAHEIKKFSEMPDVERVAIGQKCRKLVEERFSLAAMHARYANIYAELVNSRLTPLLEAR